MKTRILPYLLFLAWACAGSSQAVLINSAVSNPLPADGAMAVEPDATFSWDADDPDHQATQFHLTIGVGAVVYDYVVHTDTIARGTQERITYTPSINMIQTGGPYWWRVDKVLASEIITGPVWTFTTRSETAAEKEARMAWFRNGKVFGAIVWGLYAGAEGVWPPQTGTKSPSWTYAEWMQFWKKLDTITYRNTLEPYLTGEQFDAAQMARLCKDAGMEMVYVMPRHHDGYAIWDTRTSTTLAPEGFKITNSPYNPQKRDYLKELVDALHAEGLRVGFYFSLGDWHHPDFPHDGTRWAHPQSDRPPAYKEVWANYVSYLHQQVREIADPDSSADYGRFDAVYFDYSSTGINGEDWGATKLVHMVRQHNPDIIINNRLWNGLDNPNGDFSTPEAVVDNIGYNDYRGRDWEAIMSANNPPTWGYGRPDLYRFKTAAQLVWDIVDVVSKGGLIELSVSPKADGSLHPEQLTQYAGLGAWMARHAASIKGAEGNPAGVRPAWGEYTSRRSENRLYLHVFKRPEDGQVLAKYFYGTVNGAWLLANPEQKLTVTSVADGFQVDLPAELADSINTVIEVDYEFPAALTTTTTVADVSSENVLGLDRDANRTVDASGLSYGPGGSLHHADAENGKVWTTVGKLGPGRDYAPYIIFDLGAVMNIAGIREWGYNSSFNIGGGQKISIIGPDEVEVYTSADGGTYTFAETVHFALAPGADGYEGHAIPVSYTGIRFIKLVIKTNHDGAVFDGTGSNSGVKDRRSLTGLSEIRFEGETSSSDVHSGGMQPPEGFSLRQNYPNPFNASTKISYTLPSADRVRLAIYDVLGRETQTLFDGMQSAGEHSIVFDGSELASGIYFYELQHGKKSGLKKKLLLVR